MAHSPEIIAAWWDLYENESPATITAFWASMEGSVTHRAPIDDSGIMPCCHRTPLEVPETDRITVKEELVTCRGS